MAKRGSTKNSTQQSAATADENAAAAAAAFLKHFHASGLSGNGNGGISTGYKQLRGAAATPSYTDQQSSVLENNLGQADDSQLQYHHHQSSPTSLATISGGTLVVGGNSGSSSGNSPQNNSNNSTNPFRINSTSATSNGHIANTGGNNSTSHFRSTSTLNPQLNSSSTLHHHHNQQPHYNLSSAGHHNTSSTGGGGGGGGGGHYAANLAAGLQQQQQQQQQQSAKKTTTSTSTSLLLDPTRITSNTGSGAQLAPAAAAAAAAAQFSSTSPLSLLGEAATGSSSSSSSSSMLVPPLNNHHHHNHQLRVNTCATCSSVHWGGGLRENLASLALMCILSLLTAFLALFFLQRSCPLTLGFAEAFAGDPPANHTRLTSVGKTAHSLVVSPGASSSSVTPNFNQRLSTGANRNEYLRVFQISVCLSTLTIALNLCCLFVCAIQFLSIVKLLKVTTPFGVRRAADFIKRTSHIRVLAFGAFLLSIPIFFTGVILYTFVNFDEVPALVTSLIIGLGIIFCGVASVQNVYLWQWEKTKASQDLRHSQAAMHMQQQQQQQQQQLLQHQQHQTQLLSSGHLSSQQQHHPSHHHHPHHHHHQQHHHNHSQHLQQQQQQHQVSAASNYQLELSTLV